MKNKFAYILGAVALAGAPAVAQDWTGGYIGAQVGYANVGTSLSGVDGSDWIGGITAGYDYDFGTWVIGGGLDYDIAKIDLAGAAKVENVFRAKLRAGYKIDAGLLYAVGGWARASTDTLGDSDGYLYGAGYEYQMNGGYTLGGEILYHKFDDYNKTGINVDAMTYQLRAAYRF